MSQFQSDLAKSVSSPMKFCRSFKIKVLYKSQSILDQGIERLLFVLKLALHIWFFAIISGLAVGKFLLDVTAHNPLFRFGVISVILAAGIFWLLERLQDWKVKLISFSCMGGVFLSFFILVAVRDLPLTTISIEFETIPRSMSFNMCQYHVGGVGKCLMRYQHRQNRPRSVTFKLPEAIWGNKGRIFLLLEKQCKPYRITNISYGTDFFGFPVSLKRFKGSAMRSVVKRVPGSQDSLTIDENLEISNKNCQHPKLFFNADGRDLRKRLKQKKCYRLKLFWLCTVFMSMAGIGWIVREVRHNNFLKMRR